jgi:hypothetical protein
MGSLAFNSFGRKRGFGNANPMQMLREFKKFKDNFQGDPEQTVKNMISQGIMSQDDFKELSEMAQTFQGMFK